MESVDIGPNFNTMDSRFSDMGVIRLKDRDALAVYGPHERHDAVRKLLMGRVEDAVVLDIEV